MKIGYQVGKAVADEKKLRKLVGDWEISELNLMAKFCPGENTVLLLPQRRFRLFWQACMHVSVCGKISINPHH